MCIGFIQLTLDAEHLGNRPVDSVRPGGPIQPRADAAVPDDRRKNQ